MARYPVLPKAQSDLTNAEKQKPRQHPVGTVVKARIFFRRESEMEQAKKPAGADCCANQQERSEQWEFTENFAQTNKASTKISIVNVTNQIE
jgi:hypothetical protein